MGECKFCGSPTEADHCLSCDQAYTAGVKAATERVLGILDEYGDFTKCDCDYCTEMGGLRRRVEEGDDCRGKEIKHEARMGHGRENVVGP